MIKKYIKGHATRGNEVIAELEKLGGINSINLSGVLENYVYFIDPRNNEIIGDQADNTTGIIIQEYFEEIKLPSLPKTWEEYVTKRGFLSDTTAFEFLEFSGLVASLDETVFEALAKLTLLRDHYRQGWVPEYKSNITHSYAICRYLGEIGKVDTYGFGYLLTFQSAEIRDKFYENFRDLIEQAKEFI